MAADNGRRSPSPPDSSDQASPAARAPRRHTEEEEPRRQDKTYRRYAAGIERALAPFDTARLEWPDYISFLGRLLKAVQAHPPAVDTVPHRFAVANRLAQCLKPSLPSGVHQKAIEVYSYIFSLIGKENLALDLHVFLPGLSPVLTFASLSLRPYFLSLLETHILALNGAALRPALKALILSLVPGLEDETSEDFSRTLQIVDALKDIIGAHVHEKDKDYDSSGDEYFWQCFFLASISGASRRQGSLAFLLRRLPKLNGTLTAAGASKQSDSVADGPNELSPVAHAVISPEPGLLVRCLVAGLEDETMLVQRGYLDLLLTHLPLHSPVLTKLVDSTDLIRLVGAATSVVTRRDMSLNRRLWLWFLGPEAADDVDEDTNPDSTQATGSSRAMAYFSRFGAPSLVAHLLKKLSENPSQPALRAKPFRTCLSLMDRLEIGGIVVPQVFLPAMENMSRYQKISPEADYQEVLRSANTFFDGVESGTIWSQILQLSIIPTDSVESSNARWGQRLKLAEFIVNNFNVQEEEMLFVHLPLVVLASLMSISLHLSNPLRAAPMEDVVQDSLVLVEKLVQLMPERSELNSSFAQQEADIEESADERYQSKVIKLIQHFYSHSKGNLSISPPPFSSRKIAELLVSESANLLLLARPKEQMSLDIRAQAGILSSILNRLPIRDTVNCNDIILPLSKTLTAAAAMGPRAIAFPNLNAIAHLLGTLNSSRPEMDLAIKEDFASLITSVSEAVWDYLSPSFPKYHLEAVRCLWQLDDLFPDDCLVEALIAKCLGSDADRSAPRADWTEPARRFAVLWTHTSSPSPHSKRSQNHWSKSFLPPDQTVVSETQDYQQRLFRPLFLLLDAADDTNSEMQYFLRGWLERLPSAHKIFEVLLTNILETQPRPRDAEADDASRQIEHEDRKPDCLYYLQRLAGLLDLASEDTWAALSQPLESKATEDEDEPKHTTMLQAIAQICLETVQRILHTPELDKSVLDSAIQRSALSVLERLLQSPEPLSLQKQRLEEPLIDFLMQSLKRHSSDYASQVALLDALSASLKVRSLSVPLPVDSRPELHRRHGSIDPPVKSIARALPIQDSSETLAAQESTQRLPPPANLVKCLQEGLASGSSVSLLEKWIQLLIEVLPLFANTIFQSLIPLVESLCRRVSLIFEDLQRTFKDNTGNRLSSPEPALSALLNGLEATLAVGHDQMAMDASKRNGPKSPEPQQGFFGNVVSGVFSSEVHKSRNSTANTRLTVILCFQDALRVCLSIWAWGGLSQQEDQQDGSCLASFAYVSQRLRNKTRRILDRMFMAEALECLETIISIWAKEASVSDHLRSRSSISLLHVLEGSSPKHIMPALFNAIYSRTIPASLDAKWMSTLTVDLTDLEISQFLVEYTESLDDDAMDEIWADCMTFLRDVLTNPLPHNHILPNLLLFIVILAEKMDKTNFGEQRKMRRELGDLFLRLLTATFTTKSGGSHQDIAHSRSNSEKPVNGETGRRRSNRRQPQYLDFVETLTTVIPRLPAVLSDNDRLVTAMSNISANIISPLVHSKTFPAQLRSEYLSLWLSLVQVTVAAKIWRKDISEAFMHSKFFAVDSSLALSGWAPVISQWTLEDKDRIVDLCSRITAPTSAGLMFGVGANAARLEADKKTQLNLRRIAFVIIAAREDFAASALSTLEEKITDLMNATSASSPSSSTRAEVFMVLRALILNTSLVHLSSLWPLITAELQRAIGSALPRSNDFDMYNTPSLLQACKLLDLLLTVSPDDFQVHEWLFITDTIDAVYRPGNWEPVALIDDVAEELGSGSAIDAVPPTPDEPFPSSPLLLRKRTMSGLPSSKGDAEAILSGGYRSPLLSLSPAQESNMDMSKEDFISKVLRPFFARLSIYTYEATYSMKPPDIEGCKKALVADLFDDRTLVG